MKKIRTRVHKLFIDKHGIVHFELIETAHMEIEDLKDSLQAALKLSGGKKFYSISNSRIPSTMTPEAQEFIKNEILNKHCIASAVISENLGLKILTEYLVKVERINAQLRLFNNEQDALKWILSIKEQKKKHTTLPAFNQAADKIKRRVRTNAYEMFLDKDGIMHRKVVEDAHIDIDEMKASDKLSLEMNKGKKLLLLVNARTFHTLTPEAAKYLKNSIQKTRIATAVLSGGIHTRILADFMAPPSKGSPPLRIFTKETEAVKWLLSFKKKNTTTAPPKRKKP
jgi:hypothetical protein